MSRDYKTNKTKSKKSSSPLLVGFLVGLFLGFAIAAGVAWYINKLPSPFISHNRPAESTVLPELVPDAENKAPADRKTKPEATQKAADKSKPRFDFYKILPGTEEPVTDQDLKQPAKQAPNDAYFLQAGAFQNAADADNLKARLALIGAEATIQTIILADKGVWHRVRLGPYTNVSDLNRVRKMLTQNEIETTLVKVREGSN
jgi:cell division protein FtsN